MFPECFYAFSLSTFSWGLFALLVLKRKLSSSVITVQQDFCGMDISINCSETNQIIMWMQHNCLSLAVICILVSYSRCENNLVNDSCFKQIILSLNGWANFTAFKLTKQFLLNKHKYTVWTKKQGCLIKSRKS